MTPEPEPTEVRGAMGRARGGVARRLADIVATNQRDTTERVEALRLQAEAWRLLALIALTKPDYAREKARFLFFVSLPFVNGEQLREFIEQHLEMAKASGTEAGVFNPVSVPGAVEPAQ